MCNCSSFDGAKCKCHSKLDSHVSDSQINDLMRLREDSQFEEAFLSGTDAEDQDSNLFGLGKKNKDPNAPPKKPLNLERITAGLDSAGGFLNAVGGLFGKKQPQGNDGGTQVQGGLDLSTPKKDNTNTILMVVGGILLLLVIGVTVMKVMSKK